MTWRVLPVEAHGHLSGLVMEPVADHQNDFVVVLQRLWAIGPYNQRAVQPVHSLHPAVPVPPVGAWALVDLLPAPNCFDYTWLHYPKAIPQSGILEKSGTFQKCAQKCA